MNLIDQEAFHFLRPAWLWSALALLPILWLAWKQRTSAGAWQRVCDNRLLRHLVVGEEGRARRWPLALLGLGWLATSAALAGPTWRRLPQPTFADSSATAIVLSLSPSMDAEDVSPSRLARARFKAHDALHRQEGGQVGLVVFAGDPYPVMPLTDDPDVVAETIPMLTTGLVPGRGTRLGDAIDEARGLLEQAGVPAGRILVLSDGTDDDPASARTAAESAAGAGYPVSAVGIGPEAGALREVAEAGGGRFAALSADDSDLEVALPDAGTDGFAVGVPEELEARFDVWEDVGVWLVLVPLLLASLAFRRGWSGGAPALVFFGALGGQGAPSFRPAEWFQRADQRGQAAFEEGRHTDAAALFEDPRWRAASLYRAGDYAAAADLLRGLPDPESRYNLGNALARQNMLEDAIAAYEEALALVPSHEDARANRDLLEKLLEEQKKEEEQEKNGQQQSENQDSDSGQGSQGQDQKSKDQQGQDQQGQDQQGQDQQGQDQQGQDQQGQDQQGQDQQGQAQQGQDQQGQDQEGQAQQQSQPENGDAGPGEEAADAEPSPSDSGERPEADYGDVADPDAQTPKDEAKGEPGSVSPETPAPEAKPAGRVSGAAGTETTEEDQAIEQWLGRIPDDPAGLLREKIRRRYLERHHRRP